MIVSIAGCLVLLAMFFSACRKNTPLAQSGETRDRKELPSMVTDSVMTLILALGVSAQNMTSSPYSRYAYGDMNENVPTAYRAMGGVGIGMRNNRAICPAQPASYTSCDSLTFMLDIAASASWSHYKDVYIARVRRVNRPM